jgi:hypothetical protein
MTRSRLGPLLGGLLLLLVPALALAEAQTDRVQAGGYYRIMSRPDFQGGSGKLGFYNLYGRLLNEGPYGMLNLKLNFLPRDPTRNEVWASVDVRIEGGSVQSADPGNGNLSNFRVSQLYLEAGNILFEHVIWRLGTLEFYSGDLGLYDMRPESLFGDTVGLSAEYRSGAFDIVLALGDAGYSLRGLQYNTVFSGGTWARLALGQHAEVGLGVQGYLEPRVDGNRFAPANTPGVGYEDFYRHEVVQNYLLAHPGQEDLFPRPASTGSASWRIAGHFGFGKFGPLNWSGLYGHLAKRHPTNFYTESAGGRDYTIYIHDLTDARYELVLGNEMQFTVVPGLIDGAWAVLYGWDHNTLNTVAAGEDNREYASTVLRLQTYLTDKVHLLIEGSAAREHSLNGNLWREHVDSVFASRDGVADARGLQFGDTDTRNTLQGKGGLVFNPAGRGIYNRPSLRLLYGLQYSNMQNAFGNSFSQDLSQYNQFPDVERHWHHVIAVEAEGWF